jgi:magnesium-transporting ATPase (P-type)
MITGDNPLTAVHVARDVEIVDREALILDIQENPNSESGMPSSEQLELLLMLYSFRFVLAYCR